MFMCAQLESAILDVKLMMEKKKQEGNEDGECEQRFPPLCLSSIILSNR